ncbi:SDR family oxidoreductase [Cerasicoccus frondis]|uniref:SDR family oxidoreductase n=1 Tax=Cerasicoccus frondis TaxID=490090 RepID=UPI0028526C20|nr:SDR family oxidoreductase [Cerasicoccus frondis]
MSAPSKPLVVITGASSGIGRAIAEKLSAHGYALLLIARHKVDLGLPHASYAEVDVGDYGPLKKAIEDAEAEFGPTDCLINNAGIADVRPFEKVEPEDYEREIRTNLLGALNGTRAVYDGMIERKKGTIINVTSISDRKTCPVAVGYTASKYGLRSVSESLREAAAAAGVRVINLSPAYIRTNIHAGMGITFDEYCELLGHPDFMTAEEFADVVSYCYELPPHLCVRDLVITPTKTSF